MTLFSATQIVRPAAPASRPSGRYPVELRPSLDPNASARRAHTPAQKPKQTARTPLTGPAPSGMTCTVIMETPDELPYRIKTARQRRAARTRYSLRPRAHAHRRRPSTSSLSDAPLREELAGRLRRPEISKLCNQPFTR